ncbi:MAG: Type 1 glutamine amidotransferase-like domain-containing protein [Lachnospiraceae bacterium]|nr:Type 1 glutamine amidotransferase-like domain-containing protein [Lachnospiraceae bacterium]
MENHKNNLIFTSYGLTSERGRKLIFKALKNDDTLYKKRILVFDEPYDYLDNALVNACLELGFSRENIILSRHINSSYEKLDVEYIYVGEGNAFQILALMRKKGYDKLIKDLFNKGVTYIGASAGAMISGKDIEDALSFDKNTVYMTDFTALELWDGIVIPHYTKQELKRYIKNSPGIECRYKHIYSVANDRILVLCEL